MPIFFPSRSGDGENGIGGFNGSTPSRVQLTRKLLFKLFRSVSPGPFGTEHSGGSNVVGPVTQYFANRIRKARLILVDDAGGTERQRVPGANEREVFDAQSDG